MDCRPLPQQWRDSWRKLAGPPSVGLVVLGLLLVGAQAAWPGDNKTVTATISFLISLLSGYGAYQWTSRAERRRQLKELEARAKSGINSLIPLFTEIHRIEQRLVHLSAGGRRSTPRQQPTSLLGQVHEVSRRFEVLKDECANQFASWESIVPTLDGAERVSDIVKSVRGLNDSRIREQSLKDEIEALDRVTAGNGNAGVNSGGSSRMHSKLKRELQGVEAAIGDERDRLTALLLKYPTSNTSPNGHGSPDSRVSDAATRPARGLRPVAQAGPSVLITVGASAVLAAAVFGVVAAGRGECYRRVDGINGLLAQQSFSAAVREANQALGLPWCDASLVALSYRGRMSLVYQEQDPGTAIQEWDNADREALKHGVSVDSASAVTRVAHERKRYELAREASRRAFYSTGQLDPQLYREILEDWGITRLAVNSEDELGLQLLHTACLISEKHSLAGGRACDRMGAQFGEDRGNWAAPLRDDIGLKLISSV